MLSVLLPMVLVAVTLAAVGALAVRTEPLRAVTVDPFQPAGTADPAADTLPVSSSVVQTTAPAGDGGWQTTTLTSLREVEELLDSLEVHGIAEREVVAIGNSTFAVRWR